MITVAKFGGTSVKDTEAVQQLGRIISVKKETRVMLVSAMSKDTDELISIINYLSSGNEPKALTLLKEVFAKHRKIIKELNLTETLFDEIDNKEKELIQL